MVHIETVDASTETTVTQKSPRARRWLRRTLIATLATLLLLVGATAGIGYYFSGVLLTVDNSTSYPLTVRAVDGDKVTLDRDPDAERQIVLALVWSSGSVILSEDATVEGDHVVRTVVSTVAGHLEPGLQVAIDDRVYTGDPKSGRGLDFQSVTIPSELGGLPAWMVPPTATETSTTWVIAVHGRRATRTESLRVLPKIAAAGMPALVMSYRNDPDAPLSQDGYYHLGDSEWRDVSAAVEYARANGAKGVILYGWSMGGALVMSAMRRMAPAEADMVRGVVLDSPSMDWSAVLDLQGGNRGLPGFVTWTAKRFIEWRAGLDLGDLDQRPYAPQLDVPMLMFLDESDHTVPTAPAREFADARRDLVRVVTTTGGGHTASWNVDPVLYEAALGGFLAGVTTA